MEWLFLIVGLCLGGCAGYLVGAALTELGCKREYGDLLAACLREVASFKLRSRFGHGG